MADAQKLYDMLKADKNCKSLLSKALTDKVFGDLKEKKSKFGGGLADCIRSAVQLKRPTIPLPVQNSSVHLLSLLSVTGYGKVSAYQTLPTTCRFRESSRGVTLHVTSCIRHTPLVHLLQYNKSFRPGIKLKSQHQIFCSDQKWSCGL
ncbi:arginine kinase [Elysia marginata]|uniref:Arginine kinase n=1 Tax=Elysia marginata TaxID=1093978 RepID=A0AAV4I659_9GAST|nr:arginine kinase [Elysia marginata]